MFNLKKFLTLYVPAHIIYTCIIVGKCFYGHFLWKLNPLKINRNLSDKHKILSYFLERSDSVYGKC